MQKKNCKKVIKAVCKEVAGTREAIGIKLLEYPKESFWSKSTIMSVYFKATRDMEDTVADIAGSSSMKDRYITEDVPYGLVPTSLIAHKFNVDIPIINATINLASVINQTDYYQEGRSLKELGIAHMSRGELVDILQKGF